MEYTKGEWQAYKNASGSWTIATDNTHIADVDRHFNAYPITATPNLYEALKEIYNCYASGRSADLDHAILVIGVKALAKADNK